MEPPVTIRPFNGSMEDAEGLLAVEKATFNESPYSAAEVRAMLAGGPPRGWLAVQGEHVEGFVVGFPVTGLRGSWWEVDLLAVHPEWRGHGLGHRLIEAAVAHGAAVTRKARALVADDNGASEQAFLRAGFRVSPGARELFIFRPGETARRQRARWGGSVREAAGRAEVNDFLTSRRAQTALAAGLPDAWGSVGGWGEPCGKEPCLLVAETKLTLGEAPEISGYAELVEVWTLLYHGIWIESLLASSTGAREALFGHAVDRICEAGMDEIGVVVYEQDRAMQQAVRNAGFRSLGRFRWLVAWLPDSPALP